MNKQFAKLNLEDYLRKYTDRSGECSYQIPTKMQQEEIFKEMHKDTVELEQRKALQRKSEVEQEKEELLSQNERIEEKKAMRFPKRLCRLRVSATDWIKPFGILKQ